MGAGLFSSLLISSNALGAFNRALDVVQNNVANANTPGYAKQDLLLTAQPFDPQQHLVGGVTAGGLLSSRSEYLEQAVRSQTELLGSAEQKAGDLAQLEPIFDVTSRTGVSGALNSFFQSFSQLSITPNDSAARQAVLTQATSLAQSFNRAASGITQLSNNLNDQTRSTVDAINRIANQLATLNQKFSSDASAGTDAGMDAQLHTALEQLSEYANFTVLRDPNGSVNVLLGGQTPLVIGNTAHAISADFSAPQTALRDAQNNDITSQISSGQLGALLEEKNTILPSYGADLNTLAQSLADQVNSTLASGVDANGAPGSAMFQYDANSGAAFTLAVAPITTDQIAAATAAAPGGNENAIALSQLGQGASINGYTFAQYFGNLGARVGTDVAAASTDATQQKDLVTQAQARRANVSGVSLDEEATRLLQFQRSYEAAGKIVSVIDQMAQSLLDMLP
jgi:flagellar hook-associated protein 1 FlgK